MVFPTQSPHFDDYVNTLYELRKHKGVNKQMAQDMIADVSYYGTMMIYKGHADGMVSGAGPYHATTATSCITIHKNKTRG